jgi:hypothetical protein
VQHGLSLGFRNQHDLRAAGRSREILEGVMARKDALLIIDDMMSVLGEVLPQKNDPESFAKLAQVVGDFSNESKRCARCGHP